MQGILLWLSWFLLIKKYAYPMCESTDFLPAAASAG